MSSTVHTQHLPYLRTYAEALTHYNTAQRTHPRLAFVPLGKKTQRDLTMVADLDAAVPYVACRYHSTNVVTFYADGRIGLKPYVSRNTDLVVSEILYGLVRARYTDTLGTQGILILHRQYSEHVAVKLSPYAGMRDAPITLTACRDGLTLAPGCTEPFQHPIVDAKVSRAAYKARGLDRFTAWCRARVAMGVPASRYDYILNQSNIGGAEARLAALADPEQWEALYSSHGLTAIDRLRQDILRITPQAIRVVEYPVLPESMLDTVRRAVTTYRWAVR